MSKKKRRGKPQQPKLDYEAIRERDAERKKKRREKNRGKRKKIMLISGIALASVGVLCAAGFGVYHYMKTSGWFLHHRIAAKTEHFEVTDAMFACYFRQCMDSYEEYAAQNPDAVKIDSSKSLKDQEYYGGYAFYDMFMDTTMNTAEENLKVCEAAYAAGYQLSEDQKTVAKERAEKEDLSRYQKGVTREDLRKAGELAILASDFEEDSRKNISISDADVKEYRKSHEADYLNISIYGFTFAYDADETTSYGMTHDEAMKYAQELADCKDADAFYAYVENYVKNVKKTDETAQKQLENLKVTNRITNFSAKVQEWAKSEQAKKYATMINESDTENIVQVCMMLDVPALSEEPTADIRIIYLSATEQESFDAVKEMADKIKGECTAAGGTPEAFSNLAMKYSEDYMTYPSGGVVSCFTPSRTTYGKALNDWAFSKSRKAGNMEILQTDTGVILAYFEGEGKYNAWETSVREDLKGQIETQIHEQNRTATVTKYPENYKYITG